MGDPCHRPDPKSALSDRVDCSPIQVVSGRGAAEGKVEVRLRAGKDKQEIGLDDATAHVLALRRSLYDALEEKAEAASAHKATPGK